MKLKPLGVSLLFLLAWEGAVVVFDIKEFLRPPPSTILQEMWADRSELVRQSVPTLTEIWLGFLLAFGVGFLLAIPIAYSRFVEESIFPILVSFQVVPKVALAPLFLVWLGFGMTPKVMVAALIAFFPIIVNTVKGLRSVEPEMVQWMKSLGAKPWEIFFKLSLPWALPYIFAALKISIGLAVVGAIVGEFIGTDNGLGYIILRSTANLDTTSMFAALIVVSLLGIVSYALVSLAEKWLMSWQVEGEAAPETM